MTKQRGSPSIRAPRHLHPYIRRLAALDALGKVDDAIAAIASATSLDEAIVLLQPSTEAESNAKQLA